MSALRTHGTATFDADFIARLIGPSPVDPSTLAIGDWLAFVPECYRDQAIEGAREVGARFVGRRMDRGMVLAFAVELSRWLIESVEPASSWDVRGGTEGGR
jgi:hypothetical protein